MRQVLQNIRSGELLVDIAPAPGVRAGEVLIANAASVISAGTEKMVMDLASKSLLGKAREHPGQAAVQCNSWLPPRVVPNQVKSLCQAMLRADQRMGTSVRDHVRKHFNSHVSAQSDCATTGIVGTCTARCSRSRGRSSNVKTLGPHQNPTVSAYPERADNGLHLSKAARLSASDESASTAGATLRPGLSVVIPVFNSEAILPELIRRLDAVLSSLTQSYEVVLVNDGSRDESWTVIQKLAKQYTCIRGIDLMRNYGQHNALLCGIRAAQYDVTITMDDDLQHPPEEIPNLLQKLSHGYDVVYGIPKKMPHSLLRNVLSRATKIAVSKAIGNENVRNISAFRAIRTDLRRVFSDYRSPHVLVDVLLGWATGRFTSVCVNHQVREHGSSNYSVRRLFNQFLLILTAFTTAPLRLSSFIGFGFTLFGMGLLLYVLVQYFVRGSLPGFTFLASMVSIFGGVQLFCLGIMGEYLSRIFDRTMDRPMYVVHEVVEQDRSSLGIGCVTRDEGDKR